MSKLSRRSLVASASALPALAIPAAALLVQDEAMVDPTFAVIDTHRTALVSAMRAGKVISETPDKERTKEGDLAEMQACAAQSEAARRLAEVVPTTFTGVFALMGYVDQLHIGKVALPEDPDGWFSAWGNGGWVESYTYQEDDLVSPFDGEQFDLPPTFWVMRNVRTALRSLTGAAA